MSADPNVPQNSTLPIYENLPAFLCQGIGVVIGLPLNIYVIVNLYRRGRDKPLPSYAYFIFFRSIVDMYNTLIHPADDLTFLLLNQYASLPASLLTLCYILGETLALLLDLLMVIQWKRKTKSSSETDKFLMYCLPPLALVLFTCDVLSFFPFFLSSTSQKEVNNRTFSRLADPVTNIIRLTVFTLIFVSYYFSIKKPNLTFCTPYAKQSHRRIVKFYQILSFFYLTILFFFLARYLVFFVNTGTLGVGDCESLTWMICYQVFWCLICLAPIVRGVVTVWAFPDLLRQSAMVEPSTTLFTITKQQSLNH